MLAVNDAPDRAKWEVLWIKNRKIQKHDCGSDLGEALRVYMLVKLAERPGATLRCKNMGFPPPEEYLPRHVRVKQKVELPRPKIVTRKGKRYRKTHEVVIKEGLYTPMKKRNAEGIWWCPYCREFRRFVKKNNVSVPVVQGGKQSIHFTEPGMYCPLCGISHRDQNVRKWNPIAPRIYAEMETSRTRAPARTAASRRAARRRKKAREE